jgi:hypothetical protein
MATKTFTQAQLTAADMNTFCNPGERFVASASVTAGVLANCFTSTYYDYRIVVTNFVATTDCYLWMQLGYNGGTSWLGGGYYQGGHYQAYSTGAVTNYSNNNALPYWQICAGNNGTFPNNAVMNITRLVGNSKCYSCQSSLNLSGGIYTWFHAGQQTSTIQNDSIRWATTAGSVVSGTISVYGMVKP